MAENRELALVLRLVADQFKNELKSSQGALGSFNNFIKDWKTQLTAAGTALFAIAKSTANFGEEALKGAQKAGQTVETFTALSYAAKLADIDQQQLIVGLKSLSQNMVEASQQTGDGEALFRRLGVSATDAAGKLRPTEQVLLDLAEVFEKSADGAGKMEVAVKLFGKAGVDLIPFLNQGKAGIKDLMDAAARLGVVLSKEDAEAASKFNDEIKRLESATRGLTLVVGKELLPVFSELTNGLTSLASNSGISTFLQATVFQFESWAISIGLAGRQLALLSANITDIFSPEKARALGKQMDDLAAIAEESRIAAAGRISGDAPFTIFKGGTGEKKPEIATIADQQKLGKELLEIFLAQNRALEIRNKLNSEGSLPEWMLAVDRKLQREKENADEQKRLGEAVVHQTQLEVQIRETAAASERAQLVQNLQAWVAYDEQIGASNQQRYQHQVDLVRASLAQETQLTTEEAGRLLIAWQNHDEQLAQQILARTNLTAHQKETIELQALARVAAANEQASDDIWAGWARGMERYVQDTKSGFGLAADMARRTAQQMEQSFRTFFFDMFEGRIQSFKDVLSSLLGFVKQIASQIAAQMAAAFLLKKLPSMFSGADTGWLNNIGEMFGMKFDYAMNSGGLVRPRRFDVGGMVLGTGNRDTVSALLTPGEFVVNRRGVATLENLNRGMINGGGFGNLTVNVINAPADTEASVTPRWVFDGAVIDVILRHRRDLRPLMGGA